MCAKAIPDPFAGFYNAELNVFALLKYHRIDPIHLESTEQFPPEVGGQRPFAANSSTGF